MKTVNPGHLYMLKTYDSRVFLGDQPLMFVKRMGDRYPGNADAHPGTLSQEVLRALIDRVKYVNGQAPCSENGHILENLRAALLLFESRAARVHGLSLTDFLDSHDEVIEDLEACPHCGHLVCRCSEEHI